MARPTDRHGTFSQAEVDAMDIEVVAALLGVGEALDVAGQAREMAARRHAAAKEGRRVRWADLTDD